ncbi:PREDICTED: uncharacterized protein At3g49055-like isoform X2 [Tarenaya hassleriana]|uniref:uncharacterized protein At3g49055-like isoform X2 n=1 Tax=Tarenaya hassleriana TaxID=28532 RepID=UPI0008FCEC6C|nr:PREDICTED: uncharacterized protein At3g49055-like isoform X2 [Tarenaya hassleriana]
MEISNTGIIDHASIISDQNLEHLRRRPSSSLPDSSFLLLGTQRSDTIDHHNNLIAISDEVNHKIAESRVMSMIAESIRSVEDCLSKSIRILRNEDEELVDFQEIVGRGKQKTGGKQRTFWEERMFEAVKLAEEVESKIKSYVEFSENEKRETKRRVEALTEENIEISGLLRVAFSEKKLKGMNEPKRLALLQIAERGLQRVGLGFGFGFEFRFVEENGNECSKNEEEEEDSVMTIEKTMKNLRHEISQLQRSLDETLSDNERLLKLAEEKDQKLGENATYINELENGEKLLAQNVEELMMEIREAEAEVSRWRVACELEVNAGKLEVEERNRVISILKAEIEKTSSELVTSKGKLKLKEELAKAAMAAEEAAKKSLWISDKRAAELLSRIEQLMRQLEEADAVECRLCWPWRAVTNATAAIRRDEMVRKMSVSADTRVFLRGSG